MKKFLSLIFSRLTLIGLLVLAQFIFLIVVIYFFSSYWYYVQIFLLILSLLMVIYILTRKDNPAYKLAWIIPILIFPVFGGFFYLFFRTQNLSTASITHLSSIVKERHYVLSKKLRYEEKGEYHRIETFLENRMWPSYTQTASTFIPSGKQKLTSLLDDLQKATKFIFMEYFIITESHMWDVILDVLKEKEKEGVEIRIMYDDFGSANKLPLGYHKKLMSYGFKVVTFNKLRLHINFAMNYRDHRKIVVIDGKVGYTGGINIGDEYINEEKRFGHWHDAAIRLEGDAVWSLTVLFLENWRFATNEKTDYQAYYADYKVSETQGLYIPFGDFPLDTNLISKNIYLSLIGLAKKRLLITTPYLILDNELITALTLAASSGVDVRIVIPGIPDKKLVYMVTESYVPELISAGVKVYKYNPGFIHSKIIVCDDDAAMIGTSNLDYRSLYLHFENNVFVHNSKSILDMIDYFKDTLKDSSLITAQEMKKRNLLYRALQTILRAFSPLL